MKIFLCWSGERSLGVAKELEKWMPKVIQAIEPWLSEKNINKGARWLQQLSKNLEKCDFGILCLTPENLNAPWLLFESGALSKAVNESHVCPLLFNFDQSLLKGPLSQFQATKLEKDDMLKLMKDINSNLGEKEISLSETNLEEIFSMWWPKLEDKLEAIPPPDSETSTERPPIDIMKETLEIVRSLDRQFRATSSLVTTASIPVSGYNWGDLLAPGRHITPGKYKYITVGMGPEGYAETEGQTDAEEVDFEDPETK